MKEKTFTGKDGPVGKNGPYILTIITDHVEKSPNPGKGYVMYKNKKYEGTINYNNDKYYVDIPILPDDPNYEPYHPHYCEQ